MDFKVIDVEFCIQIEFTEKVELEKNGYILFRK